MEVVRYKTRPVVIETVRLANPNTPEEVAGWCGGKVVPYPNTGGGPAWSIVIPTLEGDMRAEIGDYIIKGLLGEFYPCKPEAFEAKYERAN